MTRSAAALLALVLCAFTVWAVTGEELNRELKELAKARFDAFAQRDTAALAKMCVKEFKLISPSGVQMSLEETKRSMVKAKPVSRQYTLLTYQLFVADDQSMAFSVSEAREEAATETRSVFTDYLVTEVYMKCKGSWRILVLQLSRKTCDFPG